MEASSSRKRRLPSGSSGSSSVTTKTRKNQDRGKSKKSKQRKYSIDNMPSTSYIYTNDETDDADLLKIEDIHIDSYLAQLVEVVKSYRQVRVAKVYVSLFVANKDFHPSEVSCYLQPIISDVPNIDLVLFPLYDHRHYTLVSFDLRKHEIGYYDSLHGKPVQAYYNLSRYMERQFGRFKKIPRKICEGSLHHQEDDYNCAVYLCRTAEEICFHGKNNKLVPFDIDAERLRFRQIIDAIADSNWDGQWFPTCQELYLQEQEASAATSSETSPEVVVGGDETDTSMNSGASTPTKNSTTEDSMVDDEYLDSLLNDMEDVTVARSGLFNDFLYLSVERECYRKFKRTRQRLYPSPSESIGYQKMLKNELDVVVSLCKGFPDFMHLQSHDKKIIFKKFYQIFIVLERLFDTLSVKKSSPGKKLLLPTGKWLTLGTPEGDKFAQNSPEAKILISAADRLLPLMKDAPKHVIEISFAFSWILWDVDDIYSELSEITITKAQENIRNIVQDLRVFYGRNETAQQRVVDTLAAYKEFVKIIKEEIQKYSNDETSNSSASESQHQGAVLSAHSSTGRIIRLRMPTFQSST